MNLIFIINTVPVILIFILIVLGLLKVKVDKDNG